MCAFDIELSLLLEAIHLKYSYDFRHYAISSLKHRLTQAMQEFACGSLSALQERILREPEVMYALLGYLTVQVSDMFRDPSFFRALRTRVCPRLEEYAALKVWIPGCATGEEVYSTAILLREEGLLERTTIYATDIHLSSLREAAEGIYAIDRMAGFSRTYRDAGGTASLSDYYTVGYGAAIFDKTLRDHIVFSDHSLANDGIFAEVQLITCRNVLIYFDRALQDRAVALFREALAPKGFLSVGAKETISFSAHAADFADFVREERIYQKR